MILKVLGLIVCLAMAYFFYYTFGFEKAVLGMLSMIYWSTTFLKDENKNK